MSASKNTRCPVQRSNSFESTLVLKDFKSFDNLNKKADKQEFNRSIKSQYRLKSNFLNIEDESCSKTLLSISNKSLYTNKYSTNSTIHPDNRKRSKIAIKLSNFSSFIRTKQKKIKSIFERSSKIQLPKENFVNKFTSRFMPIAYIDQSGKHLSQSSRSLNSFFPLPTSRNNLGRKTSLFQLDSIILHEEITERKFLKSSNMQHYTNNVCALCKIMFLLFYKYVFLLKPVDRKRTHF